MVFSSGRFNDQLKVEAGRILLRIVQIYKSVLLASENDTFGQIAFILEELRKTNLPDNKLNLLMALRALISGDYSFAHYQKVYDAVLAHLRAKHHPKLHALCFSILKRFNCVFK